MRGSLAAIVRLTAASAAVLAFVLPASAHPTSTELAAKFARGEYMTAASEAEAAAGADDLAFAARALLAYCMTGTQEPDAVIVERRSRDYVLSRIRAGVLERVADAAVEAMQTMGLLPP